MRMLRGGYKPGARLPTSHGMINDPGVVGSGAGRPQPFRGISSRSTSLSGADHRRRNPEPDPDHFRTPTAWLSNRSPRGLSRVSPVGVEHHLRFSLRL